MFPRPAQASAKFRSGSRREEWFHNLERNGQPAVGGLGLRAQFDAVLHFDATRAVDPLDRTAGREAGEAPETFPFAV